LTKYDAELEERYTTQSAIVRDELSATATDDEKCQNGRQLLGWGRNATSTFAGRERAVSDECSYHTLADQFRVGWHPEFSKVFGVIDGASRES